MNMDSDLAIQKTVQFVHQTLDGEGTGHDWWHIYRVWQNAIFIGREENADLFTVQLGALLHDIADWKFHDGDEHAASRVSREWLESIAVNPEVIDRVCEICDHISFKGAGVPTLMETLEGKIVQDADRLEALGAMGIARTFVYGGHKGRPIYDPDQAPVLHKTFDVYKKGEGSTINHFYEKLLLLKDRMNTSTGKRLAEGRHRFIEQYLEQFFAEWKGER